MNVLPKTDGPLLYSIGCFQRGVDWYHRNFARFILSDRGTQLGRTPQGGAYHYSTGTIAAWNTVSWVFIVSDQEIFSPNRIDQDPNATVFTQWRVQQEG